MKSHLLKILFSIIPVLLSTIACGAFAPVATQTPTSIPSTATPIPPTATAKPTATKTPEGGTVNGIAYILGTNQPIQNITVLLFDASSEEKMADILFGKPIAQTATDSNGQFSFSAVPEGVYVVAVKGGGNEVAFCGNSFGTKHSGAAFFDEKWVIAFMKIEEKFTVNVGSSIHQDIIVDCN